MNRILPLLRPCLAASLLLSLLFGVAYPLAATLMAQGLFHDKSNGSLIVDGDGEVRGSRLIGQQFTQAGYFWSRPSATGPTSYNGAASSGSNLAVDNPALMERVQARIVELKAADPGNTKAIPVDLVTASGSGLDPDISPAAAHYQIARVAKARGLSEAELIALVNRHTSKRQFGVLGEPRVNVLALNAALNQVR